MKFQTIKKQLEQLIKTPAPSGYEWSLGMADAIQSLVGSQGARIGNNLVYEVGKGSKTILISAHMDEVGFFVKHDENTDRAYLNPIGAVSVEDVVNQKINIIDKKNQRVITKKVLSEVTNPLDYSAIYIELEKGTELLPVGSLAVFSKTCLFDADKISATSLDNKVGVVALIALYSIFSKNPIVDTKLVFCFAASEEQGMNGLMSAVKKFTPDFCIDIDSAYAQPYDGANILYWNIPEMGKGPALQLMGEDWILPDYIREYVEAISRENKLKLQYEIPSRKEGGTQSLMIINAGYSFLQINIPVAQQHTSISYASLGDIKNAIELVKELVSSLLLIIH